MTTPPKPPPARPGGRAGMKRELPEHFKSYKHVWVFIEYEHGEMHPVSLELLGEARKLADKLGAELAGVVMGAKRARCRKPWSMPGNMAPMWSMSSPTRYCTIATNRIAARSPSW